MRIILFLSNSHSYGLPFTSLFYSQSLIFQSTSCKTNTYIKVRIDREIRRQIDSNTEPYVIPVLFLRFLTSSFPGALYDRESIWLRISVLQYCQLIVMCTVSQFTKSVKNRFCKMSATNFVNRMPIETEQNLRLSSSSIFLNQSFFSQNCVNFYLLPIHHFSFYQKLIHFSSERKIFYPLLFLSFLLSHTGWWSMSTLFLLFATVFY